jgi:membrane associated rhomboid family serine protease
MRSLPTVVKNLLIVNVLVYLAQLYFWKVGTPIEEFGALFPYGHGFRPWQLITYMFMHDHNSWLHIIFNMFALYMFGSQLEEVWGAKRFFNFYMICGIFAGVTHLFLSNGVAVGASGAIMGCLAAFAYLFPNIPLMLMFIPIPIKAKYLIPGLMVLDLYGAFGGMAGDNVAHWAHLGGALCGFLIVLFWNKNNRNTFY